MASFTRKTRVPASAEEVYAWHARPGAFARLSPPWQAVRLVEQKGRIEDATAELTLSVPIGPIRVQWVAKHVEATPGRSFKDVQTRGPFARWEHSHRFVPQGPNESILEDSIDYALPVHALSRLLMGPMVEKDLERMFRFRHETTRKDIEAHQRYKGMKIMKVLVSGASGLVGGELLPFLQTGGHEVVPLTRGGGGGDAPSWDLERGVHDPGKLEGFDGVVHLAGENIAGGRWTESRKKRILESRSIGTRKLAETLASLERKPKVLVSASAIGYYGDRGDEVLTAESRPGEGFLAEVCREWETATAPAREAGIRVVNLRIGIVLSAKGGALAKMLTPFKLGVGGVIGDGEQYMSWIAIDDLAGVIQHALMTDTLEGPVNAVAGAVTNREFTKVLGRVLGRPTIFPLPGFAAKLAMGEMAEELLLSSARVDAAKLRASGYGFRHESLENALRHVLGR